MMQTSPKDLSASLMREPLLLTKSHASQLANGRRNPSLALAVRIEDELGIPPRFWIERHTAKPLPTLSHTAPQHDTGIAPAVSGQPVGVAG